MKTKVFLVLSVALLGFIAWAAYKDSQSRQYLDIQNQYKTDYASTSNFDTKVQQLFPAFPAAMQGSSFKVERCISCHVPDIAQIGPQEAAKRLSQDFFKYEPSAKQIASDNGFKSTPTNPQHPAVIDQGLYDKYGQNAVAKKDGFTPYTVTVQGSSQPVQANLPGFLPSFANPATNGGQSYGIDQVGCIVCHNGSRLALDQTGAHQNLIVNPEYSWSEGAALFYKYCATCHGVQGEGGVGPPLNNQDRLGYFNEDYYYRCIEYGYTGFEHVGTIMPAWGSVASDFHYDPTRDKLPATVHRTLSETQIQILTQFIRHWENYDTLP